MGLCLECGCSREDNATSSWCNLCLKKERESHTNRLSQN